MVIPTDRGRVVIAQDGNGLRRLEIYAGPSDPATSNPIAAYTKLKAEEIMWEAATTFVGDGRWSVSEEELEVFWDSDKNVVHIVRVDPIAM